MKRPEQKKMPMWRAWLNMLCKDLRMVWSWVSCKEFWQDCWVPIKEDPQTAMIVFIVIALVASGVFRCW